MYFELYKFYRNGSDTKTKRHHRIRYTRLKWFHVN